MTLERTSFIQLKHLQMQLKKSLKINQFLDFIFQTRYMRLFKIPPHILTALALTLIYQDSVLHKIY